MNTRKLSYSALFVALGVICSPFNIPLGFAKCFPVQHLINVLTAVLLGPLYAVMSAFTTSLIRNLLGTGSLLAFPGSMIGAFLAGMLYQKSKKISFAFLGEIIGTGIIGSLVAYPVALFFLGKEVAIFTFVLPFSVSTIGGSIFALILLKSLEKTNILEKLHIA
ncbi:protein ThiW [Peptoanaerobacter stomatis]|uniref:Protein ThiW n=1 Tax=Peptoanaerobacter stomatis TaxID=796937 RepID=J6HM50_9FIRM|nr:energy coupling factor transporter S component ThiW [Peptoanaerobacter stomatis]EJU23523.1 protein ThiW [Peptoanaerobacter stomatis]NWO24497.1 energy coupling factor transporter S component ThiW [Peptostreptococcaceae bacterium oral taxon 081]